MLLYRIRWAIVGLFVVLAGGSLGYRLIEGWSWEDAIWMVMITLTTIGYGEPSPLSLGGRILTAMIVVGGLGLGTYTLGRLTRYVVEGELRTDLLLRRRRKTMKKISNHYIVVGCGRLGREVVAELEHRGHEIVVVDQAEPSNLEIDRGVAFIPGDGTQDETLEEAGIDRARGIAIATGEEAINVLITLTARQMNPNLHIIMRLDDKNDVRKAYRAGADAVINPYTIGGTRMAQGLLHPHAAQLLDHAVGRSHQGFEIQDIAIGNNQAYHGPLTDLQIPQKYNVLIVAVRKPDGSLQTATERGTSLEPGDIAVAVGKGDDISLFARAAAARPS